MEVVGNNGSQEQEPRARADATVGRRRTPWPLVVVALLLVVGPFLAWYWTWFGRALGDDEIEKYLREGKPRHVQHALSQIEERIEKGDKGAGRWFPRIVALSQSGVTDVRMTAAWVMGVEHRSEDFHSALLRLLDDPEPIVRRNAALALVRFGDPRCRVELAAMLRPYAVKAGADGVALTALTEGTPVKRESLLVKFRNASGAVEEVRSPLPGAIEKAHVRDGENITRGSDIFIIAPDAEQVGDALVGLYYFGGAEDLAEVERYAGGVAGMPADVKAKAAQTAQAIKRRMNGQ
ncbi:MAG TPA: HEAT repeat domain-containing protein [Pyrinomonadaceae bacterium]|nr:HEAT repeat domain-containing protein [Pyrinomonadaceae bacterium]